MSPAGHSHLYSLKLSEAKVRRLRRHEADGWRFDLAELEELITDRTRLIFICNPNNPTGRVLETHEIDRNVTIAARVGAYVLCDEVYAGLELEWRSDSAHSEPI